MSRRRLWLALAVSLIAHLLAVTVPDMDLEPKPDLMRLEARLVRASAAAVPSQTPPPPARAKRKPKPAPKPVPERPAAKIVAPDAPDVAPAAATPPPADPSVDSQAGTSPEPLPSPDATASPPEPVPPPDTADAIADALAEGVDVASEAAPSPTTAAASGTGHRWPRAGQITFAVFMGEQRFRMGQSVHRWQMEDDGSYRLVAITEPTGVAAIPWFNPDKIYWESRGRITPQGLQPTTFVEKREVKGTTGQVDLDWVNRQLHLGGHALPLVDGTQDVLSLFYQLGYPESAGVTEMPVTTGRKLETYKFHYVGDEELALPFGMTWRTRHMRASWGTREMTEVWVALDHFGLPVQVRSVDRKGVVYYLVATEVLVAKDAMDQTNP